ncbi:hypothetical protein AWB75_05289 [Caballeronia catudaia]|uniref:Uncharacterized protein n=1 Tax=Caballeronia catudaia TaxID=1777136 RepID=A0A158CLD2_9BURK|nr:hypothetical protein [Caballeronia catudaia]SAK82686.1 hypothetical protein AWB75_05289 [Caballeronia catudaia]
MHINPAATGAPAALRGAARQQRDDSLGQARVQQRTDVVSVRELTLVRQGRLS